MKLNSMRYRLRTLLIILALGPPVLAWLPFHFDFVVIVGMLFGAIWLAAELIFRVSVRLEPPIE